MISKLYSKFYNDKNKVDVNSENDKDKKVMILIAPI